MIDNILELNNILNNNTNYKLSNLSADFTKFLLYELIKTTKKDLLLVFDTDSKAENFYNFLKEYDSKLIPYYFPSFAIEPYQNMSPNKSILSKRISTLSNIILNPYGNRYVITSINSLITKTIPKDYLKNRFLEIKVNTLLSRDKLIAFLIRNNYKKVSLVSEDGEFALRGDIVDIYCSDIGAIRLDFYDDHIEKIKLFDPLTQKSFQEIDNILIKPSSEIILEEATINHFKSSYKTIFNKIDTELFEYLDNKIIPKGIEQYISLFYESTQSITDYLNNPTILYSSNFNKLTENAIEHYAEEYEYRKSLNNIFNHKQDILLPDLLILNKNELTTILKKHNNIILSELKSDIDEYNNYNFTIKNIQPILSVYRNQHKTYINSFNQFIIDNKIISDKESNFLIFARSEEFVTNIMKTLNDNKLDFSLKLEDKSKITILLNPYIEEGFIYENYIILCENEITGIKKTFNSQKKSKNNKLLQHLNNIEIGNIVVHNKHGFGKYLGIKSIKINEIEHDFLEIAYKDQEKLYLPVENIDLISRYSGSETEIILDKLGSSAFEKKHNKVKEKIKDIAYDLIQIAAKRNIQTAPIIDINNEEYMKFLEGFPYVETEDQLAAINDIISDLQSGHPADRLICGDVGFGKTEVILRAAFLVANAGYQIAIITPTTLLSNQHYVNFKNRFKDFPIRIAQLSRFTKNKEKSIIKKELQEGSVDVIIGTHSLLAKDINFKNLALIVVDEEQSFGVVHKEKLKTFKEEVHIITLSATPIPRTIQLAFKGIKDLSLISTPPIDKLPIITYVLPVDYFSIKKAILKEVSRDGQIYLVCPKISDIEEIKRSIDGLNLDISYIIAHAQMPTETLEKNMLDFREKKYNLLISTSIIESGLDMENVNTIIILRADLFGLAQLYQLRGRVGRGKNQAFAYLFYQNQKFLGEKAEKRLQILQNLDYLGASFSLASYDLDMRGAGNLLGEEQSGHIKEIGSELYQKLLEQEIVYLKSSGKDNKSSDYYNFSPNINLNIPIFIPKKYIPDMETIMEIYQRLGKLNEYSEIINIKEEMIDRFGNIPYQVENLLLSIELKIMAKKAFVEKIIFGAKAIMLSFYNNTFPNVDALLKYLNNKESIITLKPDGLLIYSDNLSEYKEQIKLVTKVLEDLQILLFNR